MHVFWAVGAAVGLHFVVYSIFTNLFIIPISVIDQISN